MTPTLRQPMGKCRYAQEEGMGFEVRTIIPKEEINDNGADVDHVIPDQLHNCIVSAGERSSEINSPGISE